jgi:hypothetical protein
MTRRFHNPEFRMHYLENGIRALIVQAQTGETIGIEFDEKTAAAAAALLLDPHPGHHQEPPW